MLKLGWAAFFTSLTRYRAGTEGYICGLAGTGIWMTSSAGGLARDPQLLHAEALDLSSMRVVTFEAPVNYLWDEHR